MSHQSKSIRASWLLLILVALMTCYVLTLLQKLPTVLGPNREYDIKSADNLESRPVPLTVPVQRGCICLDKGGHVTGIFFLTSQGEYWERRDGKAVLLTDPKPENQPADQQPIFRRHVN